MKPTIVHELFETVFDLIDKGLVKIIEPIVVNPISEIEATFRLMQSGKHVGKLLVEVATDQPLNVQPARPRLAELRQDGSYLVVGGTGGLGVAVVRYLAQRGAKRIIALSRSGGSSKQKGELTEDLRSQDVELDLPVSRLTADQWHGGLRAKVTSTMNLQAIFGGSLDFFIILSSMCGVLGTYSQGTYCAGNAFLDAFARSQTSCQTVVRSIDLGMVAGEGITSHDDALAFATRQGLRSMTLEDLTAIIDFAIQDREDHQTAERQIIHGVLKKNPQLGTGKHGQETPDAKFSHIWMDSDRERRSGCAAEAGDFDVQSALRAATTPDMATNAIMTAMRPMIAQSLAISEKGERSVASYGVASLTAVELRNWIASHLGSHVETLEIMSSRPMVQLAEGVARKSRLVDPAIFNTGEAVLE